MSLEVPILDRNHQIVGWTRETPKTFGASIRHAEAERLTGGPVTATYVQIKDKSAAVRAALHPTGRTPGGAWPLLPSVTLVAVRANMFRCWMSTRVAIVSEHRSRPRQDVAHFETNRRGEAERAVALALEACSANATPAQLADLADAVDAFCDGLLGAAMSLARAAMTTSKSDSGATTENTGNRWTRFGSVRRISKEMRCNRPLHQLALFRLLPHSLSQLFSLFIEAGQLSVEPI
jgi:hypothetical protein